MWFASGEFRYWFQCGLFAMLAIAAWRYGGGPERVLAGVLLWFAIAFPIANWLLGQWTDFSRVDTANAILDGVALIVSLAVALKANRVYPMWFAAFQVLAATAHLVKNLAHGTAALAYVVLYAGPSYCQIVILALGIWNHHRRVRKYGTYRAWRNSSSRLRATIPSNWPNG
ncbi:hypothetical protein [Tsuneonella suprasediminis]|uniref:hypothetical protein n=1 Tax=Tsuneonella suprasediminis TaxID=2306996 RepID=UPI002F938A08